MTKRNFLRKGRYCRLYPFFLLAFLLGTGCQKQPILNFGSGFAIQNGTANVIVVDTGTVSMSTVYTDSSATAGTGFLLVGTYNDSYLGKISSRAFLQVTPPPGAPTISVFDSYDSIGLILLFKKGNPFYGDTTKPQSFQINQVSSLYQLNAFQHAFFSNFSFPLSPTNWGTASATIDPNIPYSSLRAGDSIRIRMPDSLGRALFNMFYNKSDSIIKPANWLNWFHGLCISPSPGSEGAIYGFQDSAVMRIYYHEAAAYTLQKFLDFTLTDKPFQFNNISFDRTGSPIATLDTSAGYTYLPVPPATPSAQIGNAGYLDGPLGLQVKLTFPNLQGIALRPDYIGLLRAQLTVRPAPNSFTTTWRLPPQVNVYATDQTNRPLALIPSTTSSAPQTGNLTVNFLNPLTTFYTYDITAYVASQIASSSATATQNGVLLSVAAPANTTQFTRTALSDFSYPQLERVSLSVYYISLYPHQ